MALLQYQLQTYICVRMCYDYKSEDYGMVMLRRRSNKKTIPCMRLWCGVFDKQRVIVSKNFSKKMSQMLSGL